MVIATSGQSAAKLDCKIVERVQPRGLGAGRGEVLGAGKFLKQENIIKISACISRNSAFARI